MSKEFYIENGNMVFTELYHKKRGFCCGNKCRHCCYTPRHVKGGQEVVKVKSIFKWFK